MISPSEAESVERCAYYAVLRRRLTPTTGPGRAFGGAFAAMVAGEDAGEHLALLPDAMADELPALVAYYKAEMRRGAGARVEYKFALLATGERCDWDDQKRITRGKIDAWWTVSVDGALTCVLRDDKTGDRPISHPRDNLQFGVYAKALEGEIPWGTPIVAEVANPRLKQLVRYAYESGEVERLWERFLAADRKASVPRPVAEPGAACVECWERQRCDVRMLPAMQGTIASDLKPFMFGGPPLTAESAMRARHMIDALSDLVDRADEQLRAFADQNGPIRDGDREWGPSMVSGRASANVKLLEADGLTRYITQGKPYKRFAWKNARG